MALFWTIVAISLVCIEASTSQMVCIWFAGGAFVSLIATICGLNIWWQISIFVAISAVLLILTRPLVRKLRKNSDGKTNVDALIGKKVLLTETVDNINSTGSAKIGGISWSVRSEDNSIIETGKTAIVIRVEGVKLIVKSEE